MHSVNQSLSCYPIKNKPKVFLGSNLSQKIRCTDAVIGTVDSDVAILEIYYSRRLAVNLLVQLGTGSNVRIIDVGNTYWQSELVEALPSLHAISGCDLVSAFNGIGKAKWLSILVKRGECKNATRFLGDSLDVTEIFFATIERMVCHLYLMLEGSDVNSASYKKFSRVKAPYPHHLPPRINELVQHTKRAVGQTIF